MPNAPGPLVSTIICSLVNATRVADKIALTRLSNFCEWLKMTVAAFSVANAVLFSNTRLAPSKTINTNERNNAMARPAPSHNSRFINTTLRAAVLIAIQGVATIPASSAQTPPPAKDQPTVIDTINVVGSRRVNASSTDTPVPVDFISLTKVAEQGGQFDLAQTLQYISPSFNSTRQTGADGADLIDSAALRGLGSDQTLVLVNGKRRHTVSLVNIFGARNRGNTGTDMNAIPLLAIDNVQVLRDGAAAQYGSDAIAGVIDIGLKKRPGCESVFGYGQYSEGDGKNYLASAYCGLQIGDKGAVGITAEYLDRGRSNRASSDHHETPDVMAER